MKSFDFLLIFIIFSSSFSNYAFGRIPGQIMAFIDINADCFTDLVVNTSSNSFSVWVASDKEPTFAENVKFSHQFPNNTRILNIGVGDFDGDSYPDLAVSLFDPTATKECAGGQRVQICYSSQERFRCEDMTVDDGAGNFSQQIICEQPLIFDCNLDERSDLLTVIRKNGKNVFACLYNASKEGQFNVTAPFPDDDETRLEPADPPTSLAFVDVTGDLNPEIVLWTKLNSNSENKLVDLAVLQLTEGKKWKKLENWMTPPPISQEKPKLMSDSKTDGFILGQSVYDDFNKDGLIDHLLPFCKPNPTSGKCEEILLDLWINKQWMTLSVALTDEKGQKWALFNESSGSGQKGTIHVRSGDYTQDGYPDLLVVLEQVGGGSGTEPKRNAFYLQNMPCAAGQDCKNASWERTFGVEWGKPFQGAKEDELVNAVNAATFFDLGEDGTLDVLLEYRNMTTSGSTVMDFSNSVFEGDTTFLKVQVFTSTCLDPLTCRYGREGSAISLPGAALVYTSSDTDGNPIKGSYTQRSVTSYRPLLLPYALFGLGRTPNFVEKLHVGAPSWPFQNRSWEQLVPNSRIYVIPHPLEQPKLWVHRLYLTPNRLIIYSFISLSSVCALIIIVVFALHMQERRMDKKERELQRERFHFDAM